MNLWLWILMNSVPVWVHGQSDYRISSDSPSGNVIVEKMQGYGVAEPGFVDGKLVHRWPTQTPMIPAQPGNIHKIPIQIILIKRFKMF